MTTESTETTIAVEGETFTDAVAEAQEAGSLQLIESGTAALPLELDAGATATPTMARPAGRKRAAKGLDVLDAIQAAKAETHRPCATKAPVAKKSTATLTKDREAAWARAEANAQAARTPAAKVAAAKAAPKRVMAEDAYGKYIQSQELAGHRVTTLTVERVADAAGKARYLTASYEVATLKGKVLGQLRFDHGSWFVVRDDDETKVPSIGKGIAALAGK
jgi:hypothetical protein